MKTDDWKYSKKAKLLNPIDDDFFKKMAEDKEFCEEILRVILQDESLTVEDVISQNSIKNLQGRSVVLDALCKMADGSFAHVEVQKENDDDHVKRVRYNSSCITANISDVGIKFKDVPNVYVIYISKSDIFHGGLTLYHVDSVIRETGTIIDDGLYRVFVNATVKDDSDVSKLMDIFTKNDTYDFEKFPKTSTRKKHFKIDEEGRQEMSDIVREIAALERAEGRAEGRTEGRTEGKMLNLIELAYAKINNGQSVSEISEDLLADPSLISLIFEQVTASIASGVKISPEEIYQKIKEKESIE